MVQTVLNAATQESDNPDLRDRGFIYWRLLSTDPEAAKAVVLSEKPLISDTIGSMEESLLDVLVANISTLSSVYHKPPQAFVSKMKQVAVYGGRGSEKKKRREEEPQDQDEGEEQEDDMRAPVGGPVGNLLDLDDTPAASGTSGGGGGGGLLDDFYGGSTSAPAPAAVPKAVVLAAPQGDGFQVEAVFVRRGGQPALDITFVNQGPRPITSVAFQFNKNIFGAVPLTQPQMAPIAPGGRVDVSIQIGTNGPTSDVINPQIQIAMKNDVKIYYFAMNATYDVFYSENGRLGRDEYLATWKSIAEEKSSVLQSSLSVDAAAAKLAKGNIFEIARRQVDAQTILYISAKADPRGIVFLGELTFNNAGAIKSATRTSNPELVPLYDHALFKLLQ